MPAVKMFVALKVPDNASITAFNTLKRMGCKELKNLERSEYYEFDILGDENKFKKDVSNADILVNANKHKVSFSLEKGNEKNKENKNNNDNKKNIINVLVQDLNSNSGLLSTLKERLGFNNIKKLKNGILWTMFFDEKSNAKKIAVDIAKNLLVNENYQKYRIISQSD